LARIVVRDGFSALPADVEALAGDGELPRLRLDSSLTDLGLAYVERDRTSEFSYTAGAEEALRRAEEQAWTVVSLRRDWRIVFPEL
jgi:hypothetical protein